MGLEMPVHTHTKGYILLDPIVRLIRHRVEFGSVLAESLQSRRPQNTQSDRSLNERLINFVAQVSCP